MYQYDAVLDGKQMTEIQTELPLNVRTTTCWREDTSWKTRHCFDTFNFPFGSFQSDEKKTAIHDSLWVSFTFNLRHSDDGRYFRIFSLEEGGSWCVFCNFHFPDKFKVLDETGMSDDTQQLVLYFKYEQMSRLGIANVSFFFYHSFTLGFSLGLKWIFFVWEPLEPPPNF